MTEEKPKSIIEFLLGAGEFKGCWFGDSDPEEQTSGKFWWRKHLKEEIEAISKDRDYYKELLSKADEVLMLFEPTLRHGEKFNQYIALKSKLSSHE